MNIRQASIVDIIEKNETISLEEIKKQFRVSDMTARRDLLLLEKQGYIARIKGGAIVKKKIIKLHHSFHEREKLHITEKKAIAMKAVELIEANEKIILDAGTTTLCIAKELSKREKRLTVATNSLAVANVLSDSPVDVMIFGGYIRKEVPDLIGPLTEKYLTEFHADKLFIGCDGIVIDQGLYTSDLYLSSIDEKMMKIADRVILITDSSKFGKKAFMKYSTVDIIDTVVTDSNINQNVIKQLSDRGIRVLVAQV